MANRVLNEGVQNEVLFISNDEERAIYITIKNVEGAEPGFEPYTKKFTPKSNMSDLDISMKIDTLIPMRFFDFITLINDIVEEDVRVMVGTEVNGGEDLDVIDLKGKLESILNNNKKGIYAYQPIMLFIPAQ